MYVGSVKAVFRLEYLALDYSAVEARVEDGVARAGLRFERGGGAL